MSFCDSWGRQVEAGRAELVCIREDSLLFRAERCNDAPAIVERRLVHLPAPYARLKRPPGSAIELRKPDGYHPGLLKSAAGLAMVFFMIVVMPIVMLVVFSVLCFVWTDVGMF